VIVALSVNEPSVLWAVSEAGSSVSESSLRAGDVHALAVSENLVVRAACSDASTILEGEIFGTLDVLANSSSENLSFRAHRDVALVDDDHSWNLLWNAGSVLEGVVLGVAAGSNAFGSTELEILRAHNSSADSLDLSVESRTADLVALSINFSVGLSASTNLGSLIASLVNNLGAESVVDLVSE